MKTESMKCMPGGEVRRGLRASGLQSVVVLGMVVHGWEMLGWPGCVTVDGLRGLHGHHLAPNTWLQVYVSRVAGQRNVPHVHDTQTFKKG